MNVGTVDRIEGNRIKLKKRDSSDRLHNAHRHYIELGFVAGAEGTKINPCRRECCDCGDA